MVGEILGYTTFDILILGGTFLLIVVNVVYGARFVFLRGGRRICRFPRDLLTLPRLLGLGEVEDELVRKGLDAVAQRGMTDACSILLITYILAMAAVIANMVRQTPRWMTDGQTLGLLVAIAFLTLATTCWKRCVSKRPRAMHGALMLIQVALNVQCDGFVESLVTETCTFLLLLGMSMKYPRVVEVTLWNLFFVLVTTPVIAGNFSDPVEAQTLVLYKLWLSGVVIVVSITTSKTIIEKIHADLDAARLRNESSALSTLLDLVCDVVVTLDENLRIRDKASRFSAMVMLQGKSVEGLRLHDYIPDAEDREQLERSTRGMQADPTEAPASRALHVKLRDSMGNLIPVELFCVQAQTLTGKKHIVGIREFSDFAAAVPECKTFAPTPKRLRHRRPRQGRTRPRRAGAEEDGGSRHSGSSSDSSSSEGSLASAPDTTTPEGEQDDQSTTSAEAVQLALLRVMEMCSVGASAATSPPATGCCPLHRRISLLRRNLNDLDTMPCAPEFGPTGVLQPCNVCGLLPDAGAKSCFACGATASPTARVAL